MSLNKLTLLEIKQYCNITVTMQIRKVKRAIHEAITSHIFNFIYWHQLQRERNKIKQTKKELHSGIRVAGFLRNQRCDISNRQNVKTNYAVTIAEILG